MHFIHIYEYEQQQITHHYSEGQRLCENFSKQTHRWLARWCMYETDCQYEYYCFVFKSLNKSGGREREGEVTMVFLRAQQYRRKNVVCYFRQLWAESTLRKWSFAFRSITSQRRQTCHFSEVGGGLQANKMWENDEQFSKNWKKTTVTNKI